MKQMIVTCPFLSVNEVDEKESSFLAKLKDIDIDFSPGNNVNMAGFTFEINIDPDSNPIKIDTDFLDKVNKDDFLDKVNIEDKFLEHPDFIEWQRYVEEKSEEFGELQAEASMYRKEVSLLETMVGEKDTSDITSLKYTSQEHDKDTGLYYYGSRYYDPEIGRFIQPDSIIDGPTTTQGWNRYMYVHGNPVSNNDPTGNSSNSFIYLYYGQGGYQTYNDGYNYGYSGASVDYASRMQSSSLSSMMSWGSRPMHQQFGSSSNSMSDISNWSASTAGPAINSNYQKYLSSPLTAPFNFDFGADYYSKSMENFQNGDYFIGAVHYLDFACEAGYDGLATFIGVNTVVTLGSRIAAASAPHFDKIKNSIKNGGKTFSQFKADYWSKNTKPTLDPIINPKTGQVWKQYTEFHHRFIHQRAKWAPNWLENNRFNLQKVNSLEHAIKDPYRARFAPKWVKEIFNLRWK